MDSIWDLLISKLRHFWIISQLRSNEKFKLRIIKFSHTLVDLFSKLNPRNPQKWATVHSHKTSPLPVPSLKKKQIPIIIRSQHPTHHLNLCLHDPSLYCPDLVTWLRDGGRRRGRLLPRAQSNHSRFQCGKFQVKIPHPTATNLKDVGKHQKDKTKPNSSTIYQMTPPTDHDFILIFFSNYFKIYFDLFCEPQSLFLFIFDRRYHFFF